jgi:hypothetical protein
MTEPPVDTHGPWTYSMRVSRSARPSSAVVIAASGSSSARERCIAERALAAAAQHDDAAVREIAAWAVQRTRSRG